MGFRLGGIRSFRWWFGRLDPSLSVAWHGTRQRGAGRRGVAHTGKSVVGMVRRRREIVGGNWILPPYFSCLRCCHKAVLFESTGDCAADSFASGRQQVPSLKPSPALGFRFPSFCNCGFVCRPKSPSPLWDLLI
ncbi:unnamed protein product [Arabidopsis halleri]